MSINPREISEKGGERRDGHKDQCLMHLLDNLSPGRGCGHAGCRLRSEGK